MEILPLHPFHLLLTRRSGTDASSAAKFYCLRPWGADLPGARRWFAGRAFANLFGGPAATAFNSLINFNQLWRLIAKNSRFQTVTGGIYTFMIDEAGRFDNPVMI